MKKGGSNGEFWKKNKKPRTDEGGRGNGGNSFNKGPGNPNKKTGGEGSIESQAMKASDTAWTSKLTPTVISAGTPVDYTVSIAIPSSILKTAKSTELKSYLVAQIARACAIHEVDEIIIFMDSPYESSEDLEKGPGLFFCRLLQYLECPPYLRNVLFSVHNDLKFANLLPDMNMPHHMSGDAVSLYREGVVVDKPTANGSLVDVGLSVDTLISHPLQAGIRVTVKLSEPSASSSSNSKAPVKGEAVSPRIRAQHGLYWGYETRLVSTFTEIFSGCPYTKSSEDGDAVAGYDLLIGNSDKGAKSLDNNSLTVPRFKHALIVFGGAGGIESFIEADKSITTKAGDAECLFDHWLDLAPSRGSRAVRTEEAVMIGLAKLTSIFTRPR